MLRKLYQSIGTLAIAGITLTSFAATPLMAADEPGTSPNAAVAPNAEWMMIEAGESVWYEFHYDYDNSNSGNTPEQAIVELEMGTEDSISFDVWTPAVVDLWVNNEEFDPIGAGSKKSDLTGNDDHATKLMWATSTAASETFYVIVENNRLVPSYYQLQITGNSVSFPTAPLMMAEVEETAPVMAETVAVETVAVETVAVEPVAAVSEDVTKVAFGLTVVGGDTPASAIAPAEGEVTLNPGEMRFYTFRYHADHDKDAIQQQAIAQLKMSAVGAVEFEVWTPDQVNLWAAAEEFDPVGAGSPRFIDENSDGSDNRDPSTLIWAGSSTASSDYLIAVKNVTNNTATYTLSVNGPSVSY